MINRLVSDNTTLLQVPGKALLLGEYAVLEGYPSLVMGLNRYFNCRITEIDGAEHILLAKPLLAQEAAFTCNAGRLHWQQADMAQKLPFIEPLFSTFGISAALSAASTALRFELDSSDFFINSETAKTAVKLGLGSSAALTVALGLAWHRFCHPDLTIDRNRWLPLLVNVHHELQGGRGSGADIAASLYGALIHYRINSENVPSVERLQWPESLEYCWIWLGQSASTRVFLRKMSDYKHSNGTAYQQHMSGLGEIALHGVNAAREGHADRLQSAITRYGDAMQALGNAADAPIYTDAHRRLQQIAGRCGVAFKPSGAGGGDIAVAASTDTLKLSTFARQAESAGYPILPLKQSPPNT